MAKISAITFLYNEERNLRNCLESIRKYVDEIIIFDLESTDKTREIASEYTTEIFHRPYLLCGDFYKMELALKAKGDWLLWFYGDEVFPEKTAKIFEKLVSFNNNYDCYGFMRHEYMDNIRAGFNKEGTDKVTYFGTPDCQNYQIRLCKKNSGIYYTELVHAEIHGEYKFCGLPPEYWMEHRKESSGQEFDNTRLYIVYQQLINKYGNTKIEPYKQYVDSYKDIVAKSEERNLKGDRKISLMEEFWHNWRRYINVPRITLEEFQSVTGIPYSEFLKSKTADFDARIAIEHSIKDKILEGKLEVV